MTIGTAPLTPDATWQELDAMLAFLATLGITQVAITYGWGCKAEGIAQPVEVALGDVRALLQKNIAQGIYHLGEDNLYIGTASGANDPALTITLCHDADIHFEATDAALETRLVDEWQRRGHRVWQSKRRQPPSP